MPFTCFKSIRHFSKPEGSDSAWSSCHEGESTEGVRGHITHEAELSGSC